MTQVPINNKYINRNGGTCIHMVYFKAIKINILVLHTTTWMNLT